MSEFLEQFLLEARELVEQASDDLLALEEKPDDIVRLESAFRAFHTLKGAAGIVEFAAMGRALHAAEDVLSSVRAGAEPVTTDLIGACLTCLDQVVRWLDAIEVDGQPPADADRSADAVVGRFEAQGRAPRSARGSEGRRGPPSGWAGELLARHAAAGVRAAAAVCYTPDPGCFFRGEDPVARVAALPGLVVLELQPTRPWPALDALDPFACELTLLALVSGTVQEAERLLHPVRDQVDIQPVAVAGGADDAPGALTPAARALLEAQIELLGNRAPDEGSAGRLASAGRVATNVLRRSGRPNEAQELERVLTRSQAAEAPGVLVSALEEILNGTFGVASEEAEPAPLEGREAAARALRVDVERIDALVRLTGELTVAKNGIAHVAGLALGGTDAKTLGATLKQHYEVLDRLVGELQQAVLSVRVLPLGQVFHRFPRLVRDIGASLGKPARLVMDGEATEADKAIVDALFEPLLHTVRNAIDHGIEGPDERTARGKPQPATIHLRAAREGEHVVIEVADDGRGIDLARIRQVAAERQVASTETLAAMTDQEVSELIFTPGFSTADRVTRLSGRGVGMNAVVAAVERIGGRVALKSRPGEGTTVRFTLPFTVMLTRVMTVEAGGQVFGIPFDSVVETARVARERIMPVGAARAFVLRDRTLPLIDLAHALGGTDVRPSGPEADIVVAAAGGHQAGLEVERLGTRMDVMLKPVDGLLAGLPGIAGTTLLSDGRVLLVLDLQEILR
jgi:two-component system, chemotaxis family, sensor kinase CheA